MCEMPNGLCRADLGVVGFSRVGRRRGAFHTEGAAVDTGIQQQVRGGLGGAVSPCS